MTNFAKIALSGAALAVAAPAVAGESPIVVQSGAQMEKWSGRATNELDRKLEQAEWSNGVSKPGIVQLGFSVGEDGRAKDVTVLRSSGHARTDTNAILAVSQMDSLGDAPVFDVKGRDFRANIVFARNEVQKQQFFAELSRSERARLARGGGASTIVIGS